MFGPLRLNEPPIEIIRQISDNSKIVRTDVIPLSQQVVTYPQTVITPPPPPQAVATTIYSPQQTIQTTYQPGFAQQQIQQQQIQQQQIKQQQIQQQIVEEQTHR